MKTRFAPSPTGHIHFGNFRTALFNYLLAKKEHGTLLLRIENTDVVRSKDEYVESLLKDLKDMGIGFDEGPYFQTTRGEIYEKYYKQLEAEKLAYPCFCTEQQLAITRKIQLSSGLPPRYSGACRSLSKEQVQTKLTQGLKPTLRFKIPNDELIEFEDLVKGPQKFSSNDIGDFIIRRNDGTSPFMFSNAIDDAEMKVTHALRGDDHLTNTPRQIVIFKALNLRGPRYGHLPLIYGLDGAPLSKRNGSLAVRDLLKEGFFPLALINYLARLGHYYEDNNLLSLEELAEKFALTNVNTSPAKHDASHLKHWQKEVMLKLSSIELYDIIKNDYHCSEIKILEEKKLLAEQNKARFLAFLVLVQPNLLMPKDIEVWSSAFFAETLTFGDVEKNILQEAGVQFFKHVVSLIKDAQKSAHAITFAEIVNKMKEQLNISGKKLFLPLRVALTSVLYGPELGPILEFIGLDAAIKRFEDAAKVVTEAKVVSGSKH